MDFQFNQFNYVLYSIGNVVMVIAGSTFNLYKYYQKY